MYRGSWLDPVSAAVMFATGSIYSHCGLWFERSGQTFIVEISQAGLKREIWQDYQWRRDCDLFNVKDMDQEKAFMAYSWLMGPEGPFVNGADYDYSQIVGLAALVIDCCLPKSCKQYNPFDVSKNYICSELVQVALEWAGYNFPTPEGYSTPQSIVDSGLLERYDLTST
jgi:hypothetical protein